MMENTYPSDWKIIAASVKDAAGWACVRCGHAHCVESWHVLTVHHLDGLKSNCSWWNLAALCQRCHLHIQGKVRMDRIWMFEHSEWMKPYVAGYYAAHHGLPDGPNYVLPRIEELIRLGQGIISLEEVPA